MEATNKPWVKICCIASLGELWTAIAAGAAAVGLVSSMPSGPGVIDDKTIAEIIENVTDERITTFLLTALQDTDAIIAQWRRLRPTVLQLVDRLATGTYQDLREALPGVGLVQVIHVTGQESYNEAIAIAPYVDALLLDSGNQTLAVKELGGTGRVHDWSSSRAIRETVPVPVYLAGGLTAENVAEAIREVGPFGLDLCTGVRTDGNLDPVKLMQFFRAVQAAGS